MVDNLQAARDAMSNKLEVSSVGTNAYEGKAFCKTNGVLYVDFEINGEYAVFHTVAIERPQTTGGWTQLGETKDGAILCAGVMKENGKEILVFSSYNTDGTIEYLKADTGSIWDLEISGMSQPAENEIYNALINKYRSNGAPKAYKSRR